MDSQPWNQKVRALDDRMIRRVILWKTRDLHTIDDLVQEVFVRLLAMAESRRAQIKNFPAFARGMAQKVAQDWLRKRRQSLIDEERQLEELGLAGNVDLTELYHRDQQLAQVCRRIGRLPAQRSRVVTLSRVYGFNVREIAKRLGIKTRTVSKHLELAMRSLVESPSRAPKMRDNRRSSRRTTRRKRSNG